MILVAFSFLSRIAYNKSMKTVSVLLSTYNGEKYIRELLESVLNQKSVELTIFIRDDGSTDSTLSVLREYQNAHSNIRLEEGTNKGYVQSFWSLLMDASETDYYAFCDQDDIWEKDKLIQAIHLLESQAYPGPKLYTSNVKGIDGNGDVIRDNVFPVQRVLTFADCLQRGSLPGCTFVFNQELAKEARKYHGPQISHDWTLYIIAKAIGEVYYDDHSYIRYRLHQDNTIGIDESASQHIKKKIKRFIQGEYKQVRSSIAKSILKIYGPQMDEEDKKTALLFSSYQTSIAKTLELANYKEYRNLNFMVQALTKKI